MLRPMDLGISDVLGLFVALYVVRAVMTGDVFAPLGARERTVERETDSRRFWTAIALYAALSVALITLF